MAKLGLSLACLCISLSAIVVQSEPQDVFSIYGKSAKFQCPLEPKSAIYWYDWVYNQSGDKPAIIYKDGVPNSDEYHVGRFSVDPKSMELTISDLREDDAGEYYCATSENEEDQQKFVLALGNMPECQGHVTDLRVGQQTNLECSMEFTGNAPEIQWLRESEIIDAKDETGIGKASYIAEIDVVSEMDKQTFMCRVVIGDMVEECALVFDVKFGVEKALIKPEKEAYAPGSEFMCTARGNPAPEVKVTLPDGEVKMGVDQVKVVIPNEWEGMTKSIVCEASNKEDGIDKSDKRNFTFLVSSKVEPTPEGSQGEDGDTATAGASPQTIGIVAGIVIGAVVLIIIIIAVVCIKKRQSKPPKGSKQVPTKDDGKGDINA